MTLLAERYGRRPIIPLEEVRVDFFYHLTMDQFLRKLSRGEITLPVMRIEPSQKSPRNVHLRDLAAYLDWRAREASRTQKRMTASH